jgi:hydrogenase nickel incorporation protein HypB
MCATCGCSETESPRDRHRGDHEHGHAHDHPHGHANGHHAHPHPPADEPAPGREEAAGRIRLERDVLEKNDRLAAKNREWLARRRILALNLVSSPGAGKTTLLERTIRDLHSGGPRSMPVSVIEGDQETEDDARRIRAAGAPALQINTGAGCHLDAAMVARALLRLEPPPGSVLMIENVGNLVCPALFDLGEEAKVLVVSVTEGEDKPRKYPHMFRAAQLLLLNKLDLLPHLRFDVERFLAEARRINPALEVIALSAWRGDGLSAWYDWLRERRAGSIEGRGRAVEVNP